MLKVRKCCGGVWWHKTELQWNFPTPSYLKDTSINITRSHLTLSQIWKNAHYKVDIWLYIMPIQWHLTIRENIAFAQDPEKLKFWLGRRLGKIRLVEFITELSNRYFIFCTSENFGRLNIVGLYSLHLWNTSSAQR